jgi:hypothetical protein
MWVGDDVIRPLEQPSRLATSQFKTCIQETRILDHLRFSAIGASRQSGRQGRSFY